MKDQTPMYYKPLYYAAENEEMDQYRASRFSNQACRDAIEKAIAEHYRDNHLDPAAVKEVTEQFGYERTLVVLARTVKERDWDARFSNENKAWAKSLDDLLDPDTTNYFRYLINKSHPGLVDLFLTQARREYAKEQEKKPSVREGLKLNAERVAVGNKPVKHKEPEL